MNCEHLSILTYELNTADKKDFNRRLEDVLNSGESLFGRSFFTPNGRGHRARSMLTTTKSKDLTVSTNQKLVDSETETAVDFNSQEKTRRSSTKHTKDKLLAVPFSFSNCEQCGAIVFKVSH